MVQKAYKTSWSCFTGPSSKKKAKKKTSRISNNDNNNNNNNNNNNDNNNNNNTNNNNNNTLLYIDNQYNDNEQYLLTIKYEEGHLRGLKDWQDQGGYKSSSFDKLFEG